ncbi:MAG: lipase family protein [Acidobacteria bacterium]|nr:lipase family protein [Acidobacteriota bacterium]
MHTNQLGAVWALVADYWPYLAASAAIVGFVARGAALAWIRRPKTSPRAPGPYFTASALLSQPPPRPAYSDRMAYVLAEMSDLAYYRFEGTGGMVDEAVERALLLDMTQYVDVRAFLDRFAAELLVGRRLSRDFLEKILDSAGFALLDVIDVVETQGFVCRRDVEGEAPYLVLAFRGTEKKVSDWLTDARCVPAVQGEARVHSGFLEAFDAKKGAEGRTAKEEVQDILARPDARDDAGRPLPLFITGHSLGGALALLATRLVAPDVNGACYTFGAPRVGNYEYFRCVKTPVYRVVNSADVVPRVPPGAFMTALCGLARALSWLLNFIPGAASLFDRVETILDRLHGYRHYGDLRYLSDVAEGRFQDVRLLSNPPAADRVVWAFRRMARDLFVPLKSHNMHIYRRKLWHVANDRDRQVPAAAQSP